MPNPEHLRDVALAHSTAKPEFFYGPPGKLSVGAGLIYSGIRVPVYDSARRIFQTRSSYVLVLSHECDLDQVNVRPFNKGALVVPIIPLQHATGAADSGLDDDKIEQVVINACKNNVHRLFYLPPLYSCADLAFGSLAYLNDMCSTHVRSLMPQKPRQ